MSRLGNSQILGTQEEIRRCFCGDTSPIYSKRYDLITRAALAARRSQISQDLREDSLAREFRGQNSLNVLHDERGWSVLVYDSQIVLVEKMTLVIFRPVSGLADVS
jgi:hypothetical protein